ncbi:hypothetical protein [Thalassotalea agarivorans]|uniref:Uncharacterized protein n=1 Tax=Thalassotalea agarivorans TaxID=349064 RepID=A0A1I0E8R5_THASX|nr:hypothetical protein [Thalassotalea agarivorans]SET40850.1 hypothetical protein SAMN05660429_01752 [Thalassotalea agarivorans]
MKFFVFLTAFLSFQSYAYDANNQNCYSVGKYFDAVVNPVLGDDAWPSKAAMQLSSRGNSSLDNWLRKNIGKNTSEFSRKFQSSSLSSADQKALDKFIKLKEGCEDLIRDVEQQKTMGKPHSDTTRGQVVAEQALGDIFFQGSKKKSDSTVWLGTNRNYRIVGQMAPYCDDYYDQSLIGSNCGQGFHFLSNQRTAEQVCWQFAKRSNAKVITNIEHSDSAKSTMLWSYEGGKKWVLRSYSDAAIKILALKCS